MQRRLRVIASPVIILSVVSFAVFTYSRASSQVAQSPYVNQLSSPVRGLSAQEVNDLLNGHGAGYARMAELNSYPGPAHILEIKEQLNLSVEQTQKIEAAFQTMNAEAKRIGRDIVEREQELSASFASGTITPAKLQTQTELLAALYAELRATHLEAHLEITPMLSPQQITAYNTLRGYTSSEVPNEQHRN
jgi:Spy/CpxP family protein refolding chaperone